MRARSILLPIFVQLDLPCEILRYSGAAEDSGLLGRYVVSTGSYRRFGRAYCHHRQGLTV